MLDSSIISRQSLGFWPYVSSGRNLKLPSRRPSIVCENCLFSLETNARRIRAFHIMDPKGVLDMLLVFLEERGSRVVPHPSFENFKVPYVMFSLIIMLCFLEIT